MKVVAYEKAENGQLESVFAFPKKGKMGGLCLKNGLRETCGLSRKWRITGYKRMSCHEHGTCRHEKRRNLSCKGLRLVSVS